MTDSLSQTQTSKESAIKSTENGRSSGGTSYTNVEGLLLRESDVRDAAKMSDAQLVKRVKQGFQKIHDELPWIIELRKRFANRPRGKANIAGCKTWIQFCDKVLSRTPRQIQRVLQEAECDVSSHSSDAAPDKLVANVKLNVRTKKVTYSSVAYHPAETAKPVSQDITPLVLVDAPNPEPSPRPDTMMAVYRRHPVKIPYEGWVPGETAASGAVTRAATWLSRALHAFEKDIASLDVDPEALRERMGSDQLEILRSCHEWMETILRAEKRRE